MASQEELFLEQLLSIYERGSTKIDDIIEFSPIIGEFIEKTMNEPLLHPILDHLFKKEKKFNARLNSLVKKGFKKINLMSKETIEYIKNKNINNHIITNQLAQLSNHCEPNAVTNYLRSFALKNIFTELLKDNSTNHRNFIQKHAFIDENNLNVPIKLFLNFDDLEEELHFRKRMDKIQDWYALRCLLEFYMLYNPELYLTQKNKLKKSNRTINLLTLNVRSDALKRAIDVTSSQEPREEGFQPKFYLDLMQQLYYYLKKKLLSNSNKIISLEVKTIEKIQSTSWKYDAKTRYFYYLDRKKRFRAFNRFGGKHKNGYGLPGEILRFIIETEKGIKRRWTTSNLYELIMGPNPETENFAQAIYDACKQINSALSAECNLKNFLIFNLDCVQINPEYLS